MIASGLWCEMHRSTSKDDVVLIERDASYEEFLSLLGMSTSASFDDTVVVPDILYPPAKETLEFVIFNDGVPCSVMPEHDVIRHISDEAIDDLFPPSVDDIAEMEAAEDFVEQMAWLAYLDECDEEARNKPTAGRTKRWSVRRAEGLRGKPTPPRPKIMTMAGMNEEWNAMCSNTNYVETMLVPHVKNSQYLYEHHPRNNNNSKRMIHRAGKRSCDPKYGGKGKMRGHQGIIQTPRK